MATRQVTQYDDFWVRRAASWNLSHLEGSLSCPLVRCRARDLGPPASCVIHPPPAHWRNGRVDMQSSTYPPVALPRDPLLVRGAT